MPATIALKIGDRAVLTAQSRGRFLPAILPHDRAEDVTVLARTSSLKTLRLAVRRACSPDALAAVADAPAAFALPVPADGDTPDGGTLRVVDTLTGQPVNLAAVLRGTATGPRLQRHA